VIYDLILITTEQIPYEELEFVFQIGTGAYGEVWKGIVWGSEVAIKVAKTDKIDPHMIDEFQHEVEVLWYLALSHLRFPFCLPCINIFFLSYDSALRHPNVKDNFSTVIFQES